jgi:hypothetical protein
LEVTEGWKTLHNDESQNLFLSLNVIRAIKSRKERWGGGVMWNVRREEKVLQGFGEKSVGKRQTGGPGHRWRKN